MFVRPPRLSRYSAHSLHVELIRAGRDITRGHSTADEATEAPVSCFASPLGLQSRSVVAAVGRKRPLCLSDLSGWVLRRPPLPYSQAALHAACMQLTV